MGSDLFIGIYGNTKKRLGELLEAIASELSPEYAIGCVLHEQRSSGGERRYRDPESITSKLSVVVDEVLRKDEGMSIDFGSKNIRPFLITATLHGSAGAHGITQPIWGPIRFHSPFEQFRPSDVTMLSEAKEPPKTWDDLLGKGDLNYDHEAVYRTFGRLVGLNTDWLHPYGVEHGLGYPEHPDPHQSHMVFHANIGGFTLDFEVLRHRYWEGANGPVLYSRDLEMPPEDEIQSRRWIDFNPLSERIDDFYMRHFPNHTKDELHGFFHRIDDEVIEFFKSLSAEELQFRVELAAEETGRKWMPATAGDGGAVVGPLHHDDGLTLRVLIDFYEHLLDFYDRATGKV